MLYFTMIRGSLSLLFPLYQTKSQLLDVDSNETYFRFKERKKTMYNKTLFEDDSF